MHASEFKPMHPLLFPHSLLILTLLNLGLFFKLGAMEDVAQRMYLSTKQRLKEKHDARLEYLTAACIDIRI